MAFAPMPNRAIFRGFCRLRQICSTLGHVAQASLERPRQSVCRGPDMLTAHAKAISARLFSDGLPFRAPGAYGPFFRALLCRIHAAAAESTARCTDTLYTLLTRAFETEKYLFDRARA